MTRSLLVTLLLFVVAACTHAQRPYSFVVEKPSLVDDVVRALAANGHEASVVDGASGVIHTSWQDTGFMYGQVDNETATITVHTRSPSIRTVAARR